MSPPTRFGRYEVKRLLGEGAMGSVYLAADPEIGRQVAIKTFRDGADRDGPAESRESRERFEREIRVTGTFDHPNIVTTHDVGFADGRRFVAMEYVDGCSLSEVLAREGALHLDHVLEVTGRVADALDYAHARDIVHRDVKPENVLLTSEGIPKITDFGVAHLGGSTLTQHGTTYGSPAYMSPEQASGQPVTGASDQFSLAVIVYQMLTGERPFAGDSVTAVVFRILNDAPVSPELLNPHVRPEVGAVVMRALAKNPADRHPDCATFARALREAARAHRAPTRAAAPPSPPTAPPGPPAGARGVPSAIAWARSRPHAALGIAAATLLLGAYWILGGMVGGATGDGGSAAVESTAAGPGGNPGTDREAGPAEEGRGRGNGGAPGREGALPGNLSERTTNATEILRAGMSAPEGEIPRWLWQRARCVAVIPGVKKVSFGLGGRYGRGLVSCRAGGGWSRPSFVALGGGSVGLQIGAQSTDLVLVFTGGRAAQRLLDTRLTLGADVSVAAGPVGRTAEVGADVKHETEILSYSRNRGLFAGVSVEGATLSADREANEEAYGRGITVGELLSGSSGRLPSALAAFRHGLERREP